MSQEQVSHLLFCGGVFNSTWVEGIFVLTLRVFPQLLSKLPVIAKYLADLIS